MNVFVGTTPTLVAVAFTPWRWLAAWVAFPVTHIICMTIDWQLRDPSNPMAGGLRAYLVTGFQWSSVGLLLIGLFVWMPRSWPVWLRGSLAILQTAAAFVLMLFGWLYYVLSNGIDTL